MYEMWTRQQGAEVLVRKLWGRKDKREEVLSWCRKCLGHARQRMGPKLMNCCKPEQVGTKEHGKMLKRIQILEDGRVPGQEAKNWKIQGQKRRITRHEYNRLLNEFDMGGFMERKVHGISQERKCCKTVVHCPRKKVTLLDSTRRCTRKISWAIG